MEAAAAAATFVYDLAERLRVAGSAEFSAQIKLMLASFAAKSTAPVPASSLQADFARAVLAAEDDVKFLRPIPPARLWSIALLALWRHPNFEKEAPQIHHRLVVASTVPPVNAPEVVEEELFLGRRNLSFEVEGRLVQTAAADFRAPSRGFSWPASHISLPLGLRDPCNRTLCTRTASVEGVLVSQLHSAFDAIEQRYKGTRLGSSPHTTESQPAPTSDPQPAPTRDSQPAPTRDSPPAPTPDSQPAPTPNVPAIKLVPTQTLQSVPTPEPQPVATPALLADQKQQPQPNVTAKAIASVVVCPLVCPDLGLGFVPHHDDPVHLRCSACHAYTTKSKGAVGNLQQHWKRCKESTHKEIRFFETDVGDFGGTIVMGPKTEADIARLAKEAHGRTIAVQWRKTPGSKSHGFRAVVLTAQRNHTLLRAVDVETGEECEWSCPRGFAHIQILSATYLDEAGEAQYLEEKARLLHDPGVASALRRKAEGWLAPYNAVPSAHCSGPLGFGR